MPTISYQQQVKLKNVLLVPDITTNLISISKLLKNDDITVEFTKFCYVVKDKRTGNILLQEMPKAAKSTRNSKISSI